MLQCTSMHFNILVHSVNLVHSLYFVYSSDLVYKVYKVYVATVNHYCQSGYCPNAIKC